MNLPDFSAYIDAANDTKTLPIIERNEVSSFYCEKTATEDTLILKARFEALQFCEISVDFDSAVFEANSVCMSLRTWRSPGCPDEVRSGSKRRIAVFRVGVNDILSVTNYCKESSSWRKPNVLGSCDLGGAQILNILGRYLFTVLGVLFFAFRALKKL